MLIDTSTLVAIHNKEPGYEPLLQIISKARRRWFSIASYVEFVLVAKNAAWILGFIQFGDIDLLALSKNAEDEAINGFLRYGKGRNPAALNFGDCLVYGTAKATGANLLFKGNAFSKTDVVPVLSQGEEAP